MLQSGMISGLLLLIIVIALGFALRPRLDPTVRSPTVRSPTVRSPTVSESRISDEQRPPDNGDLPALAQWLREQERAVPGIVDGAQAQIRFANPDAPAPTPLCFLYLHGFSATWQETAPVTEQLAARFDANVLQARLAGHGVGPDGMLTPAEAWLASVELAWQIASRLGDRVVIVAMSSGAPLAVWLASQEHVARQLHALLFMSPNFGIRSRFDFLLTAPLSRYWIQWILGKERHWEPINPAQARFWTSRYSNLALIEMQKVVDWCRKQKLDRFRIPLATMYMPNDPTIDPAAAIRAHNKWGSDHKRLIPVEIDGDEASHVFVGNITAPHRTRWVVEQFADFLHRLKPPSPR